MKIKIEYIDGAIQELDKCEYEIHDNYIRIKYNYDGDAYLYTDLVVPMNAIITFEGFI